MVTSNEKISKSYVTVCIFFGFLLLAGLNEIQAQQKGTVTGFVTDSLGKPLPYASVLAPAINKGTSCNESGYFELTLPEETDIKLQVSLIGFQTREIFISLNPGEKKQLNISLKLAPKELGEVTVLHPNERMADIARINIREFERIPNPNQSIESLIKTLPGVSSANELSSQYSVRGGNYDENLVYVNDIEIIRPFLIRSGEQEGLSFINPDLVGSLRFSAGGFEARYGDKMSSVLDVTYRTPDKLATNVSLSLLGGSISLEGANKSQTFTAITGVRYKTTRLLLGSLDTKGEYEPSFTDWQMMLQYKPGKKFSADFLTHYARNSFRFIPVTRNTSFGTFAQVYNLKVYYDGSEHDQYNSLMGALTLRYQLNPDLQMKLIASSYSTYEQEKFDIEGQYLINELDGYPGSATYGDSILNIGVGGMLNHARNYLRANISALNYIGTLNKGNHTFQWSTKYQYEAIRDYLDEWVYMDSAGYSLPNSGSGIQLYDYANSQNSLYTHRLMGYIQDSWRWRNGNTRYSLSYGVRYHYWSLTGENLISPRARFSMKPSWEKDMVFYIASGLYYQPPFYKELRNFSGQLNKTIRAQKSIHFLAGMDYNVTLWNRPFKYTVEAYYKYLDNLIPYKVDNVRIRYTARNNAKGYATGLDMKLYGEFVPGVDSWASISVLSTKENQNDDFYVDSEGTTIYPGYYHRPTDQLFHATIFFQDYLPNNPSYKFHLNLVFGTSFYVSPPRSRRFDNMFPLGSYRRVDLGMSKIIKVPFWPGLKSCWLGIEIFNLFDIKNKASFLWLETVPNQENIPNSFAIPNYLTSRRLNIRMSIKF